MATTTTNYGWTKPADTEVVDIDVLNANLDDQDLEIKRIDDYIIDKPLAELRQATVQSIPNVTFTSVTFDAEDIDTEAGHDNVTNNSRYTVQAGKGGYYKLSGGVSINPSATGGRSTRWAKNGVAIAGSTCSLPVNSASHGSNIVARTKTVLLVPGDYIELQVFHSVGAAQNTTVTSDDQSTMNIEWLRPA